LTIQDFRAAPLSDNIIRALISATQAYAELNVLVAEYPEMMLLLSDMLLALDVYYQHYDTQPNIADVSQALFIPDETSMSGRSISAFQNCMAYAKSKTTMTEVLTAGDVLKMSYAISADDERINLLDMNLAGHEQLIEHIWSILHDLYSPQRQYPLLLEAAIAVLRLLALPKTTAASLQALTILLSTVCQNELASYGLARQWTLSTDPRVHISSVETSDALAQILEVFRSMWVYTTTLVRTINQKKGEIYQAVSVVLPQYSSTCFGQILSETLCIRNRDISERLDLSQKTATKYLKQLEQNRILRSVKNWREVLYFNNLLIDVLHEQVSRNSAYGA